MLALLLGLMQGLTEFFPISSSAHLKLTKMLFGVHEVPVIFDLSCHLGTLIALLWFFKRDITHLLTRDRSKLIYFLIALLPLVPIYFFAAPLREMASKPELLGLFLMVTGGILFIGQKIQIKKKGGLFRDVLVIGTMQSAALFPGISRSASTISAAKVLGWNAKEAVRFSFLLAIPTILGGNFIEMAKLWKNGEMVQILSLNCLLGFFSALIIGMMMIRFAINWLEKGKLKVFAWYCLTIGGIFSVYVFLK
ncbi:MAG: Undecaprenyl-diphosphatase [Chlamydiae bacterium]|nr:Undecaprenyl-diphosphatase [Chlamydiota bacterium]